MINALSYCFDAIYANDYEDWGTINEWLKIQNKMTTYFIDVDGVIFKNSGKYGLINWCNNDNLIESNVAKIIELQKNGSQIIITTSRTEEYREALLNKLNKVGIHPHAVVMGLNHSCRVIINDFAPTNPYPSAKAINIPRNGDITKYL